MPVKKEEYKMGVNGLNLDCRYCSDFDVEGMGAVYCELTEEHLKLDFDTARPIPSDNCPILLEDHHRREQIYHKAIERYGEDLQLNMIIEECSELIQIISKFIRSRRLSSTCPKDANYVEMDDICEEIADVKIMLEQFEVMFETCNARTTIKDKMIKKLQRLQRRLREDD